jgi:hypothetical protein
MSSALAISAVTAVLQYFFNAVYNAPLSPLGSVLVSAIAPDIVQNKLGSGSDSKLQVNLFLHQVTPNAAWRNAALPSVAADGGTRLNNPPLALDLHYLLTAYASEDTQAEALLGFGILMLHENPVLPRNQISTALAKLPTTNPLSGVLSSSGLADQIEMIKITAAGMGREEMAWVWTALKADYRPTFAFDVSVVLIQSPLASSFALPVLSRNILVQPGALAQLSEVQPPAGQIASAPGDTVTVTGQFLTGASRVALTNQRLGIQYPPFAPATITDSSVSFQVPNDPTHLPAGVYSLAVVFTDTSGAVVQSTGSVPMALAPTILSSPAPTAVTNTSGTLVTLSCNPQALPNQTALLALGGTSAPAQTFDAPTATLSFQFPALSPGSYLARLRVDGVDSPVAVNWSATPPSFTGPFVTI